jgi:hypothetical protein|tara:strand:- start:905 stop:1123 length:219 start_codon:yes stop_codon:yes gene_type:complete
MTWVDNKEFKFNRDNQEGGDMPSWKRPSGKKIKLTNPELKKTVEVVENSDEHRMLTGHGYLVKKAGRPKKED